MKRQEGFGILEIILILALVGVVGFVGYRVYQTNQSVNQAQPSEEVAPTAAAEAEKIPQIKSDSDLMSVQQTLDNTQVDDSLPNDLDNELSF